MSKVPRYLTPNKAKLQSKGITSVAARVLNLKTLLPEMTHEGVCDAMEKQFLQAHGITEKVDREMIDKNSEIAQSKPFHEAMERLQNWDWNFGKTPEFSHLMETRIDGVGIFEVHMQVNKGVIDECVVFSDSLLPDVVDKLPESFR